MIGFFALPDYVQSALLICWCVLFVADIYCVIASFIHKATVSSKLICFSSFLFCSVGFFTFAFGYMSNIRAAVLLPFVMKICSAPWVTAFLLFGVSLIFTLICLRKIRIWRTEHITPMSIKEGTDKLPMGICFHDKNGVTRLINHRMEDICRLLIGETQFDAFVLWKRLSRGDVCHGNKIILSGESLIYSLSDGSAVSFTRKKVDVDGADYYEIKAVNVTREYMLSLNLQKRNDETREFNRRLRQYGEKVDDIMREREILSAKINIHDELGETLLATRNYLEKGKTAVSRDKLLEMWKSNIALFRTGERKSLETKSSFSDLYEAAEVMGIELKVIGTVPEADKNTLRLIISGARECLTNAVHHANATRLTLEIKRDKAFYTVDYTNDGTPPDGEISEGGGLSYLRQRIEKEGGFMSVRSEPDFRLTLKLPCEGGNPNDKSIGG